MTVYLVGAGPGDPELITVKGAALLSRADAVVYDRLSANELLELVRPDAELVYVGKSPQHASIGQEEINRRLVDLGQRLNCVVRLKGGDPYVFARGSEEVQALCHAGVEVEVVPGISSAIAVPAAAGIPVTQRYSSTSFTVVTGHEDPTKPESEVNWEQMARVGGTLVILMGVANIAQIAERLQAGGLASDTPVAAIRWGTRDDQSVVRATLSTIAQCELRAPSVIVVGEVASVGADRTV